VSAIATPPQMLPVADSRDGTVDLALDSLRVVAFNTADGWMRDVTADIAREVRFRGAGGRVRVRPSPRQWRRCRTVASSAATQAARRLKGTARPHARPGEEPSLVRHGMSVA
jgi:hypothetical protein